MLGDLARAVDEVERATARLAVISTEARAARSLATDDPAALDAARRLDFYAQAHAELLAIDLDAGLAAPAAAPLPPPPEARRAQR